VLGLSSGITLLASLAIVGLWEITIEFGITDHVKEFPKVTRTVLIVGARVITVQAFSKEMGKYYWVEDSDPSLTWLTFLGASCSSSLLLLALM